MADTDYARRCPGKQTCRPDVDHRFCLRRKCYKTLYEAKQRVRRLTDVGQHPRLYSKVDGSRYDCCDYLAPKHRSWRYLHVMAKFEI